MSKSANHLYEFGPFRLYTSERLLLRDGQSIQLTPKAFDTLALLVENGGHVVEKDALMESIWPDTFVDENTLTRNISTLRKALDQDGNGHQYIETVPKLGYRFVADVREIRDQSAYFVLGKSVRSHIVIEEETDGAGQGTNDQSLEHSSLSQSHIVIKDDKKVQDEVQVVKSTTISIADLAKSVQSRKQKTMISAAAAAIALAGIAFGLYKLIGADHSTTKPTESFQKMRVTRLTSSSNITQAAISPDGKYVAYVISEVGGQSLWLRQVATTSAVPIVPPAEVTYKALAFSRDGTYIYYTRKEKNSPGFVLYQVSALGSSQRKLITGIDSNIALSPDGERFAFAREYASQGESALMIANTDGTGEDRLATRKRPEIFYRLAWSPDGKIIACSVLTSGGDYGNVVGVQVEGGAERQITSQGLGRPRDVAWFSDGSGLAITADDQESGLSQIWHLSYPGGEARRVTNDANNYTGLSLAADSNVLLAVQAGLVSNIWIAPDGDAGHSRQITFGVGKYDGLRGISYAPDGRIVYASYTGHSLMDIWIMDGDGSGQRQLNVNAGANGYPSVSSDGRCIVFGSSRTGNYHIWKMDIDGTNPKQLTSGGSEYLPQCSPDGKWVIYSSESSGKETLWRVPIDGGDAARLTDKILSQPVMSPDEKLIACFYEDEQPGLQNKIAIIPFEGGMPIKIFDIPPSYSPSIEIRQVVRWMPDGRALTYVGTQDGVSNIWSQPIDGGPPKQLTDFKSDRIFYYDWSHDGRHLVCARGTLIHDIVLITDFR